MGDATEIRAAGGVIVSDDGTVCVVHRPHYDDWSLPKGKLEPGESFEQAALREAEEEVCLRCALEEELPPAHYPVGAAMKTVRYWRMTVVEDLGFTPNDEVDEIRWIAPDEAPDLLTYNHDRDLIADAT